MIAAPPGALNLLMQPGPSSSAFQCVQHHPRPMHIGLSAQDELVLGADVNKCCHVCCIRCAWCLHMV